MNRWIAFLLYVSGPVITNWVYLNLAEQVSETGERLFMVTSTVGFDPSLPVIGLIFCLRDWVQETLGRRITWVAILMGTGVSALVSPEVALASGLAFLVSESVDFVCYTSLMPRQALAILASGVLGSMVDSAVFLTVAFGSIETWYEQTLGKVAIVALVALAVRMRPTRTHAIANVSG